jgi:dTDP-D-glucose 4,6-dehydratase
MKNYSLKTRVQLQWQPTVSLETGLPKTIDYFRSLLKL